MCVTTEAYIGEGRLDMEWYVPGPIQQSKEYSQKDAWMKFSEAVWPLYLETDASVVSLGAGLLEVWDGMNCGHDKVPTKAYQMLSSITAI